MNSLGKIPGFRASVQKRTGMMKNLLITGILFTHLQGEAQPSVQLYAYSQVFTPGIVPRRDIRAENGKSTVNRPTAITQYYIYVVTAASVSIQPEKVWIREQWYTIKSSAIVKTPVKTDSPAPVQLVPSLQKRVLQLEPGDPAPAIRRPFASLARMIKKDALILRYVWKGKVYYQSLAKITVLDPVHAE